MHIVTSECAQVFEHAFRNITGDQNSDGSVDCQPLPGGLFTYACGIVNRDAYHIWLCSFGVEHAMRFLRKVASEEDGDGLDEKAMEAEVAKVPNTTQLENVQ